MLIAFDKNGNEVKKGDIVTDFRGGKAIFECCTRARTDCKSGKIVAKWSNEQYFGNEYYDRVFNLCVKEIE